MFSSSTFGQPQQQQQTQQTSNAFGASTFGQTQQVGGGFSGFSGFGQQQPQQQQQQQQSSTFGSSFGGFGQQQQKPTTSLGFGQPANSGFSGFGSTQPQQQQPQQQQQTAFGTSTFGSSMMQQSLMPPQQTQQQQQPSMPPILQDFEDLQAAYDVNDARCKFRYAFYNLVAKEDVQKYTRPANIPQGLWEEAVSNSPDPSCMVPVFASGFADIQKRIEHQNAQCSMFKARLVEVSKIIEEIGSRQQVEVFSRMVKCQSRNIAIGHKVLRVMKYLQILRARGHPSLTRDEELLRGRLDHLMKTSRQPELSGRLAALEAHIRVSKESQRASSTKTTSADSGVTFAVLDEQTVEGIFRILNDMQVGLKGVSDVLVEDLNVLDLAESGYKQKPGEVGFRSTIR
eukprot:Partr_v1_DN28255_c0_g1_i1_m76198 putative nucleoporin